MTDANRKPWLTASEQIDHLKSRGVHFSLMSEDDARAYLEKNSNNFRLRAYRLGFPKVEEGARMGEYANLDFKMLVDLSIVDMLLRYEMLPLTLDVEHFAKVKLLKRIEMEGGGKTAMRSSRISFPPSMARNPMERCAIRSRMRFLDARTAPTLVG